MRTALKKNMLFDEIKNLTNDIDIYVILEDSDSVEEFEENKKNIIKNFIDLLNINLPQFNWISQNNDNLYNICINNTDYDIQNKCIFDITFYNPHDIDNDIDDDTSIFQYAMRKCGFDTIKKYIDNIINKFDILELDKKILDDIVFTSVEFEKFSCEKGILLITQYLDYASSKWISELENYKKQLDDKSLSANTLLQINKFIKRLEYQTSKIYINKLKNKLERYTKKYDLLNLL